MPPAVSEAATVYPRALLANKRPDRFGAADAVDAALAKVEASGKDAAVRTPKADNSPQLVMSYTGGCEPDAGQYRVINAPS